PARLAVSRRVTTRARGRRDRAVGPGGPARRRGRGLARRRRRRGLAHAPQHRPGPGHASGGRTMSEIEVTTVRSKGSRGPQGNGHGEARHGLGSRWRAATAMGTLVVRRRAWRDRGLLLVAILLVVASTL